MLYLGSFTMLEMLDYAAPGVLKRGIGKERCSRLTTIAMSETLNDLIIHEKWVKNYNWDLEHIFRRCNQEHCGSQTVQRVRRGPHRAAYEDDRSSEGYITTSSVHADADLDENSSEMSDGVSIKDE
jgi:hypothetical protein